MTSEDVGWRGDAERPPDALMPENNNAPRRYDDSG